MYSFTFVSHVRDLSLAEMLLLFILSFHHARKDIAEIRPVFAWQKLTSILALELPGFFKHRPPVQKAAGIEPAASELAATTNANDRG